MTGTWLGRIILSGILMLVLIVPASAEVIAIHDAAGIQGSTIEIPVAVQDAREITNLDLKVDTRSCRNLQYLSHHAGSLTQNALMDAHEQNGVVSIALIDAEGFSGDGSVIYLSFRISSDSDPCPLTISEATGNHKDGTPVMPSIRQGAFRSEVFRGDLNGDGRKTILDALLIQQMIEGKIARTSAADVNKDGEVTERDVVTAIEDMRKESRQECSDIRNLAAVAYNPALDPDQDGIPTPCDNCPSVYNPGQEDTDQILRKTWGPRGSITSIAEGDGIGDACDTCPQDRDYGRDSDGDGVDDACDECSRAFPLYQDTIDENKDGIKDCLQDEDHDGFPTWKDNCPVNANPKQEDEDSDGVGDACDRCKGKDDTIDLDRDSVIDCIDNCLLFANPDQADKDRDGIGDPCEDDDHDGILDAREQELAEKFAPIFYHDTDEPNFPVNVDWFLDKTALKFYDDDCTPDKDQMLQVKLKQEDLLGWELKGESCGDSGTFTSDGYRNCGKHRTYYLNDVADEFRQGIQDPSGWTIYYHLYKATRNRIMIQYWTFYAYNYGDLNRHGGDWEPVYVVVNPDETIESIGFAGHTDVEWITYDPTSKRLGEGTHPRVLSQAGGHAREVPPERYLRNQIPVSEDFFRLFIRHETWTGGKVTYPDGTVRSAGKLVNLGAKLHPLNGQVFIQYSGIWGDPGVLCINSGYWGPAFNELNMNLRGYIHAWCKDMENPDLKECTPVIHDGESCASVDCGCGWDGIC